MPTFKMTFVQATYVLVAFVYISNISATTALILTNIFGPNLLGGLFYVHHIFLDQTSFDQDIFWTHKYLNLTCFKPIFFPHLLFLVLKSFGLKFLDTIFWT